MKKIFALVGFSVLLGQSSFQGSKCANIPETNKEIVAYVKTRIGKLEPGNDNSILVENSFKSARIEFKYSNLGTKTDPEKECVFPGNALSLENGIEFG